MLAKDYPNIADFPESKPGDFYWDSTDFHGQNICDLDHGPALMILQAVNERRAAVGLPQFQRGVRLISATQFFIPEYSGDFWWWIQEEIINLSLWFFYKYYDTSITDAEKRHINAFAPFYLGKVFSYNIIGIREYLDEHPEIFRRYRPATIDNLDSNPLDGKVKFARLECREFRPIIHNDPIGFSADTFIDLSNFPKEEKKTLYAPYGVFPVRFGRQMIDARPSDLEPASPKEIWGWSGRIFEWKDGKWVLSDDPEAKPSWVKRYGKIAQGDYIGSWIVEDLITVLNMMDKTYSWNGGGRDIFDLEKSDQQNYGTLSSFDFGSEYYYWRGQSTVQLGDIEASVALAKVQAEDDWHQVGSFTSGIGAIAGQNLSIVLGASAGVTGSIEGDFHGVTATLTRLYTQPKMFNMKTNLLKKVDLYVAFYGGSNLGDDEVQLNDSSGVNFDKDKWLHVDLPETRATELVGPSIITNTKIPQPWPSGEYKFRIIGSSPTGGDNYIFEPGPLAYAVLAAYAVITWIGFKYKKGSHGRPEQS